MMLRRWITVAVSSSDWRNIAHRACQAQHHAVSGLQAVAKAHRTERKKGPPPWTYPVAVGLALLYG